MSKVSMILPASTKKKLQQNGYYKHSAAQRSERIKVAFCQLDKAMKGFTVKHSFLDCLGR
jgi:hypothetical protein